MNHFERTAALAQRDAMNETIQRYRAEYDRVMRNERYARAFILGACLVIGCVQVYTWWTGR